jgi:hypothetical protein
VRAEWLSGSPLTAASLHDEVRLWSAIGIELKLRTQRAAAGGCRLTARMTPPTASLEGHGALRVVSLRGDWTLNALEGKVDRLRAVLASEEANAAPSAGTFRMSSVLIRWVPSSCGAPGATACRLRWMPIPM